MTLAPRRLIFVVALFWAEHAFAFNMPIVPIGNPGNLPDATTGFGAVASSYWIGKYEVTNSQYVEFLNGVDLSGSNPLRLYNTNMTSDSQGGVTYSSVAPSGEKYKVKAGRDQNPAAFVSWYDAIRFVNWLNNGQANGNTEDGAYELDGDTPIPSNADTIARKPGARWVLPSEDEWYKAAYHKNDGATGNYWKYPMAHNDIPYSAKPPGGITPDWSNVANFFRNDGVHNGYNDGFAVTGSTDYVPTVDYLTDVGAYQSAPSAYGTFDQGGNVWEWNESIVTLTPTIQAFRGVRGGPWAFDASQMLSSTRGSYDARSELNEVGFRVVALVPESSSLALLVISAVVLGMIAWLDRAWIGK